MGILLIFAFISGLITILAPCIWPLLPIILSTTATGGHKKPIGVVIGIAVSFGILTLTLSYIIQIIPFDPNALRLLSVLIIGFLGLTLLIPALAQRLEGVVSRLSGRFAEKFVGQNNNGFWGGFITGAALGIIWTPCAGPILATIATLAATNSVNASIVLVTVVYMIGVSIPLLLFALAGRWFFTKSRVMSKYTGRIQQIFGVILIITAALIFTNYDKTLQAKLLDYFPSYGNFINELESNDSVEKELDRIRGIERDEEKSDQSQNSLFNENYEAPEFTGITNWIGSTPLTMAGLRGKVVLIDFWTYTCINCIRTLPYITSWHEKYKDDGLVVIGVHTPEFEFEKDTQNVIDAMEKYGIDYAVPQDNDFKTWRAYKNRYWPAKYLIDKNGYVRYTHFGEGKYEQTEKAIQILLEETGTQIDEELVEDKSSFNRNLTPETYLGSLRMQLYYPNGRVRNGERELEIATQIPVNSFSLGGTWEITNESSNSVENSILELNFRAKDVFLVMRSSDGSPKTVKVLIDGKNPGSLSGADVIDGEITVDEDRLYELLKLPEVENRKLRLELDPGIEAFAFTFG